MIEPRGPLEGLASAMVSSDLTCKKDGKRGDLDYLIALGWSGSRLNPGASSVLALHLSHDKASLYDALHYTLAVAKHLNTKRGWKMKPKDLKPLAEKALRYHVAPACPVCEGRKFRKVENSPALSATICQTCHGTGKRPFPIRNGREIAEVVYSLEDTSRVIESAVRRKLR